MKPTDDQIVNFFLKNIEEYGLGGLAKLCNSYQDLLLYEYLMRPHNGDKIDPIYRVLTDALANHEIASIIREEDSKIPKHDSMGRLLSNPIPDKPLWGMMLSHKLIVKDEDHSKIISNCENLVNQSPKSPDNLYDDVYWKFIKIVAEERYMPISDDSDFYRMLIPSVSILIWKEYHIPAFNLLYVSTLVFIILRQAEYLVNYLFFWSTNIEYWLNNKVKRVDSIIIASMLLERYQIILDEDSFPK